MNEEDIAQVVAAASTLAKDMLRAELERMCTRLLAEGMPENQVAQLLQAGREMHANQIALIERKVAGALGAPPAIH